MLFLRSFVDFAPVRPAIGIQEKTRRFSRVAPEGCRQITAPDILLSVAGANNCLFFFFYCRRDVFVSNTRH